jgi:hypothetical protein
MTETGELADHKFSEAARRPERPIKSLSLRSGSSVAPKTFPTSNLSTLQNLEQPRRALSAADAHGDDDIFRAAPLAFDQRVAGHARA